MSAQITTVNQAWLKDAFVRFSQETTCQNEWELLGMTSQLHRDPGLIPSLDALFMALKSSLPTGSVLGGAFVMLSYDEGVGMRAHSMPPMYARLGCSAIAMQEIQGLAANSDESALLYVQEELSINSGKTPPAVGVLRLPYFISKQESLGEECELEDYRKLFFAGEAIHSMPQYLPPGDSDPSLTTRYTAGNCHQRFVLLLTLAHQSRWLKEFSNPQFAFDLGALLGSCLTGAGKSVADATRWIMAAYAVKIAHFSHEASKALSALEENVTKEPRVVEQLGDLRKQLTIPTLSELVSPQALKRGSAYTESSQNLRLTEMLATAISKCGANRTTITEESLLLGETLLLDLRHIEDVSDKTVHLETHGLAIDQRIAFDRRFFERLIRNILRNAAQHAIEAQTPTIRLEIMVHDRADFFEMDVLNKCTTPVKHGLARRLFRTPVPGTSTGIGLYTIGLMFESQRLPVPKASIDPEGLRFRFIFPKHAR
jgi:hypothetical protein